jgi:hypothetical protein
MDRVVSGIATLQQLQGDDANEILCSGSSRPGVGEMGQYDSPRNIARQGKALTRGCRHEPESIQVFQMDAKDRESDLHICCGSPVTTAVPGLQDRCEEKRLSRLQRTGIAFNLRILANNWHRRANMISEER